MLGLPCTTEDPEERRKADSENRHTHDDDVYSLELLLHVLTFEAHPELETVHVGYFQLRKEQIILDIGTGPIR